MEEDWSTKIDTATIADLNLSVRAIHCLEYSDIATMRDLVSKTPLDLLKVRSLGRTTLREIEKRLGEVGLRLGMTEKDLCPRPPTPTPHGLRDHFAGLALQAYWIDNNTGSHEEAAGFAYATADAMLRYRTSTTPEGQK